MESILRQLARQLRVKESLLEAALMTLIEQEKKRQEGISE